jgi:hypothetical protein
MKYLSTLFVLMTAFVNQGRSDFLNWSYASTPNVPGISVGGASNGNASVTLTDVSGTGATSLPVIAYETQTASTTPINFNNSTYSLALKITDGSNVSGTLNFTGFLNGALTATTSSVVASFSPVGSNSITFDGHTYTVTIPSFSLVSPTVQQENIMASVSVTNASNGGTGGNTPPPPPPHGTPEPTSLLLGCLGIAGLSLGYRRRSLIIAAPPRC